MQYFLTYRYILIKILPQKVNISYINKSADIIIFKVLLNLDFPSPPPLFFDNTPLLVFLDRIHVYIYDCTLLNFPSFAIANHIKAANYVSINNTCLKYTQLLTF